MEDFLANNLKQIKPLVSVCIQAYNHEKFISECLESVIKQKTDFPFEILIGADDSSDNTREICYKYFQQYPDLIRLFCHDKSEKLYINNRATGRRSFLNNIRQSRGKFIAICEGDDYWIDEFKLKKQIDFLQENKEFSISFHPVLLYDEQSSSFTKDNITVNTNSITDQLELARKGNYIHTPSVVFVKHVPLPKYFEYLEIGDYPLHLFNAQFGKIYQHKEKMAVYRVHNASYWSSKEAIQKQLSGVRYLHQLKKIYKENLSLVSELSYQLASLHLDISKHYKNEHELELSRNHFFQSIQNDYLPVYNVFLKQGSTDSLSTRNLMKALAGRLKKKLITLIND